MKKLSTFIVALFLIFGMTQCKKQETPDTPNAKYNWVHINMKVNGGERYDIEPTTGTVGFTDGDKIYVSNGGKYRGVLTYSNGAFTGDLAYTAENPMSTTDHLHFYFLGGLTFDAPTPLSTTSFNVSIANQSSKLPVLSYGKSKNLYTDGTAVYSSTLENKCGLVKFVPATETAETVTVGGMKTTATVDFATPGITPAAATGDVTLYAESDAAKWAILLVQDEVSNPDVTIAGYSSTITSVPAVTENMYYTSGVSIAMALPYIDADFTVASGSTVKFSKGNLQYNKTTGMFSFMEHQYSTVETKDQDVGEDYANQNIVSLFGWGTSGWNGSGATYYQPYNTDNSDDLKYGPTGSYSLTDTYANADWGVYNKQSNQNKIKDGGDYAWRVLTQSEWNYVLTTRSTTSGHRYAKATVCDKPGVILLPDNWNDDTYTLSGYNTPGSGFPNTIDDSGWATLESAGCVFLPVAFVQRNGTTVLTMTQRGGYWSSTCNGGDRAYAVYISQYNVNPLNSDYRHLGYAVRLVF